MTEKERLAALMKLAADLNAKIEVIAQKQGHADGNVKADAIQKAQLEAMKKEILEAMTAQNPPKQKFVFGGKEELKANEQRLSFGQFLLAVKMKHPQIAEQYMKTVMSEGTPAQGGYTVPTGYASQIIGELNEAATIIPKCTDYPQMHPTENIPKWLTDLTVAWIAEATAKSTTKPTLTRVQSVLKKIYAIITFTDEYLQDDTAGIINRIKTLVAENMAYEIERVALVGDVTGAADPFNGILYSAGILTVPQAAANLNYQDIVNIKINPNVLTKYTAGKPEWYFNKAVLALIMNLVDLNGRPIWNLATPIGDKIVPTVLGDQYNLSSAIASTYSIVGVGANESAIFYGDYKYILLGRKASGPGAGLQVDVSNSAVISSDSSPENLWTQDETGYRFVLRKGVLVAVPAAFSVGTGIK